MSIKNERCAGMMAIAVCVVSMPLVAQDADTPDARGLFREAAAFYAELEGAAVRATMETTTQGMGMDFNSEQGCSITVLKPNQYQALYESGEIQELNFVSDGTRSTVYFGVSEMYVEEASPDTLTEAIEMSAMGGDADIQTLMMMPHLLAFALLSGEAEDILLGDATDVRYVGEERVGGILADHIIVETEAIDFSLWIAKGDQRWLIKVAPDMTKTFEQMAGVPGFDADEMPKIEIAIMFEQWEANPDFGDDAFTIRLPESATRVESFEELFDMGFGDDEGFGGMEEGSDLLGRPAPALELDLLDGGKMSLAQHKGKDIVVLDFWATWCPPCVEGLPIVTEVTRSFADKGVVFYAVNLQEQERQVRAFLEDHELDTTVAMDKAGVSNRPYNLNAIPQTVIIDKNGIVQAVHVGLLPNLKEQLTEEIETLLEGGSLVDPAPEKANDGIDEGLPMALEQVWSVPGNWSGVDSRDGKVYATKGFSSQGAVFDSDGEKLRSFQIKGGTFGSVLRLANLDEDEALELISYTTWSDPARAWDDDGSALWTYLPDDGVNAVWTGDVDGDGVDEVAIGFNGMTGLHLVDADGEPIWKYTRIGNVWHVCIADTDGDGTKEVVTTSASGMVHVFSAEGDNTANLRAGMYANMVRVATTSAGEMIAIVGGDRDLAGIDFEGNQLFKAQVPGLGGRAHLSAAEAAPDRPWVALGYRGGPIVVLDVDAGVVIATFAAPDVADLCWLVTDDGPLLVYTTGSSLQARRLVAQDIDGADEVETPVAVP